MPTSYDGWKKLTPKQLTKRGDVVCEPGVLPYIVLASRNASCYPKSWCSGPKGIGFCVVGVINRTTKSIRESFEERKPLSIWRRESGVSAFIIEQLENGTVRPGFFKNLDAKGHIIDDDPDESGDDGFFSTPAKTKSKSRVTMNPIYSKPHPFFLRDSQAAKKKGS